MCTFHTKVQSSVTDTYMCFNLNHYLWLLATLNDEICMSFQGVVTCRGNVAWLSVKPLKYQLPGKYIQISIVRCRRSVHQHPLEFYGGLLVQKYKTLILIVKSLFPHWGM